MGIKVNKTNVTGNGWPTKNELNNRRQINKTNVTGNGKHLDDQQRMSSITGAKYWAKSSVNIWQFIKIFGGLPWYLADYNDICRWPAHWIKTGDYCTGARLGLCHIFVSCHKVGNTRTTIYGHLVTSPVPFEPY